MADVEIPGVIDYYNHKIKGVDKKEQLNARYRPKVAMWEYGAAVARVNSYVICWYANRKAAMATKNIHDKMDGIVYGS